MEHEQASLSTLEQARFNMIEQQIRVWDVLDPVVLDLLKKVPREAFVPAQYAGLAFADLEIPIGHGQSMLSPWPIGISRSAKANPAYCAGTKASRGTFFSKSSTTGSSTSQTRICCSIILKRACSSVLKLACSCSIWFPDIPRNLAIIPYFKYFHMHC